MKLKVILIALALLVVGQAEATYTQQFVLGQDSVFQGQVQVAMVISCANTMTEAVTTTGHPQRVQFCAVVLKNPPFWVPFYSAVLAAQTNNPMTPLTVPSAVADSLIQTASDAQLSNIAGYYKQ